MIAILSQWRLLAAAGVGAVVLGLFALWRLEAGHARRLQDQVIAAQAGQKSAQAQASAAESAETVVAEGAQRDGRTQALHEENSHAIAAVSGSDQSLDPDLNAAGRRGLCVYRAYFDADACIQLRGPDPGQRPPAGGADSPAAP
jgi:uncharacterized membrane protein YcjF (UPF0283 family)